MKDYEKMTLEEMLAPAKDSELHSFPPEENEFMEIDRNPTPSGGDLSIAYFFDKDGHRCTREKAVRMNIVEYLNDGTRINEHYGLIGG